MIVINRTIRRSITQRIAAWIQVAYLRMRIDAALMDLEKLRGEDMKHAFWSGELRLVRDRIAAHKAQIQRWERRINTLEMS